MDPSPIHICVVNPGSTSTKLAMYLDGAAEKSETVRHSSGELSRYATIWAQYSFRLGICREWLRANEGHVAAIAGTGGLLRPVEGGVYRVNQRMITDAKQNFQGEHVSNLGCVIAYELSGELHCEPFTVDPVSVDEFEPLAYFSGHPSIKRRSLSHAVSLHAAARWATAHVGKALHQSSFVIAHLGGGMSISAVRAGRIIDVNDAASDGPFSPERTGGLPLQQFIELCFSGRYTQNEVRSLVMGKGGLVAYLGTNSAEEVEERIRRGDAMAEEVYRGMAYQIAKEIGAMATVLNGHPDAIVLTGGMSSSRVLMEWIVDRVKRIAPVLIRSGDNEMSAIAAAVLRVLNGEEQAKEY